MSQSKIEIKRNGILDWLETVNVDLDALKGIREPILQAAYITNIKFIVNCLKIDVGSLVDDALLR